MINSFQIEPLKLSGKNSSIHNAENQNIAISVFFFQYHAALGMTG